MKLANAPCSWGVFYPTGNATTPEAYLDAITRAGYRFTELGPLGYMGEDPAAIATALASRGLTLVGAAHVHTLSLPETAPALTETLHRQGRLLTALNCHDLILMDESEAYPPTAQGVVDAQGWRAAMTMIRDAQTLMSDTYGIDLHLHPHVGTCIEREPQIDRLLSDTDISLCFDTGHHAFWDQDVLAYMDKVWPRIGFVHLKNVNPAVRARVLSGDLAVNASFDHGVMCALADGAVDIPAVMRLLAAKGYDGPVVIEQDPAKDGPNPEDLARQNLAYLTAAMA